MSHQRFEKGMEDLKQIYKKTPVRTSTQEIFQAVQQDKGKFRRFQNKNLSAIAASIGVFIIGGILIGSLLSNGNDASQGPADGHPGLTGDHGDNEVGILDDGEIDKENDTSEPGDLEEDITTNVDRPAILTKTHNLEGLEDRIVDYELYVSNSLGYSTYLYPEMELDINSSSSSGEGDTENFIYNDYFSIKVLNLGTNGERSLEEWEVDTLSQYQSEGYEVVQVEGPIFEDVEHQGLVVSGDQNRYYAFLENNNSKYLVQVQLYVETGDGVYPRAANVFVEEMVFE